MQINIIFLVLYVILPTFLSGLELFYVCAIHFIIYLIQSFRQKRTITPITLFVAGVVLANIANIALINQSTAGKVTTYSYIIPKYIDESAQIWCISCTLIVIGFQLFIKNSLPKIGFNINKKHAKTIFQILVVLNIYRLFGHGINFSGSLKILGLIFAIGLLFFARLWAKENNKTYRTYTIVLLILETYAALISSFLRADLIFPLVFVFVGYFIGKGDIKYLFSYRIIPFLIIVLIYSSVFAKLQSNRSNFISVFVGEDNQIEDNQGYVYKDEAKERSLLIRIANVAQLTNVIKLVKQNGFYYGKASAPLVIALVPRIFWPEKPMIQLGAWFALEIGQAYLSGDGRINNSINMTVMGELYLDFGWIGIILGSILLGGFFAVLWNSTEFYSSPYNLAGTIFGGYLFTLLFGGIGADLQIIITLSSAYVSFFILKKIIKALSW